MPKYVTTFNFSETAPYTKSGGILTESDSRYIPRVNALTVTIPVIEGSG